MKQTDKREIFRNATNVLIYIAFIVYGVNTLLKWDQLWLQIFFGLFMLLCLAIAIFYDVLRYHNRQAIIAMNFELNMEKFKKHKGFVEKYDFFHSYKLQLLIQNLHEAQDNQDASRMLELLEQGEKMLKKNLDTLLVYYYNMFIMNVLLPNKTQARQFYDKFVDLRGVKVKGHTLSAVYNWDVVEAELHLLNGDGKKARACLKNVDLKYMNKRERAYVSYGNYRANKLIGDFAAMKNARNELVNDYPLPGLLQAIH